MSKNAIEISYHGQSSNILPPILNGVSDFDNNKNGVQQRFSNISSI